MFLIRRTALVLCLCALGLPAELAAYSPDMPTAEDMQEMQKAVEDAKRQIDKLDPATRKQFEQLISQQAEPADDTESTPVADPAKIQRIPSKALDSAGLKSYVQALQSKIAAAIPPDARRRADQIDGLLRKMPDYLPRLRATANSLTLVGAWPEAISLTARLALATGSAQDLNNLAAFLTMQRAEPAALPILITLAARYPGNSTLANNVGQAWFGLGEMKQAEKWLTLAVRATPLHPQANVTLARLQEDRRDHKAAQESLHRALRGGFSEAKAKMLRRAGGEITADDVRLQLRHRMPQDALGLARFTRPPFVLHARELPAMWRAQEEAKTVYMALGATLGAKMKSLPTPNLATHGETLKLPFLVQGTELIRIENERHRRAMDRIGTQIASAHTAAAAEEAKLNAAVKRIDAEGEKKYAQVAGGYQFDYSCPQVLGAVDNYLGAAIPAIDATERATLDELRRHYTELAYLSQFTTIPTEFERVKLTVKASYIGKLAEFPYMGRLQGLLDQRKVACLRAKTPGKQGKFSLPDFDDIHCMYVAVWKSPAGTITSRCNKLEATFDPVFSPFKASWTVENTGRGDEYRWLNASAEISIDAVTVGGHAEFDADGLKSGGVSAGVNAAVGPSLKSGPVEMGVTAGVSAAAEFTRAGFSGVSFQAGVSGSADAAGVSTSTSAQLEANVNSNWSWNAGYNETGTEGFDSGKLQ